MVIQRGWKILSDTGSTSASSTEANRSPGLQSSSDDSNCSMVTSVASPPASKPDIMKFVTTPNMAESMLQRLKQRLGCQVAGSANTSESAMRSLELLRIGVQSAFDNEIDAVIKRFMEDYFKPALRNLKENLGQNVVTDDTLQKMSCALLENAKGQYNAFRMKPQGLFIPAHTATTMSDQAVRLALKRPAAKTIDVNELTKKMLSSVPPTANLKTTSQTVGQQPILVQNRVPFAVAPARRQIFWNTASISTMTKFVLDVQANQAFGFGTDGNERLASKHPELIRYLPDAEDRDWLISQNIISQQNRNSRFLFLIHDEVCRLQHSQLYRNKPNVDLTIMHTFSVPEFMIQKMKLFFVDLNIKSRGLITSSFSINAAAQSNSHLRNALLQGMQQQTVAVAATTTTTETNTTNATQPVTVTQTATATVSTGPQTTNMVVTTTSTECATQLKPRTSTLSSSHATLTALLNNSGNSNNNNTTTTTTTITNVTSSDKPVAVAAKQRNSTNNSRIN